MAGRNADVSLVVAERDSFLSSSYVKDDVYGGAKTPVMEEGVEAEDTALRSGGAPTLWSREYIGLVAQYAAVGLLFGALPATVYPYFANYLNMQGTQVVSARVLITLPWSFKVFYGIFSDCFPVFGYRRRPLMIFGWLVCFAMLLTMACMSDSPPYFPSKKIAQMGLQHYTPAIYQALRRDAPKSGGKFIILMMFAAVGYVAADVAADSIVVELAQREPASIRGKTQTTIYVTRSIFMILANVVVGTLFNGEHYNGNFDFSLTFPQLMLVLLCLSIWVLPLSWFFIREDKHAGAVLPQYCRELYNLISLCPFYQVIAYKFFGGIFENYTVTCSDPIQNFWVHATPQTEKIFTIIGQGIFALTLFLTGKYGLHWNWRAMQAYTLIAVVVIDSITTFCTIWNVFRSQWLWLGVPIVEYLPQGISFIISTYVVVELAKEGKEGAVYGLLTTISNLSAPFASTIAKSIDARFMVHNEAIQSDTKIVRTHVTIVYLIRYVINLCALLFLPLLPKQKAETQALVRRNEMSALWGSCTVFYLSFAFLWSVTVNILSISASTSCLRLIGGRGCK